MEALVILLSVYFLFALSLPPPIAAQFCRNSCSGNGLHLRFPFGINGTAAAGNARCSYPGFSVSCNGRNQTILNISSSGEFVVQYIDYETQMIILTDPDMCLPRRLIESFDLSDSPFEPAEFIDEFAFVNCSSTLEVPSGVRAVRCLSGGNSTVYALRTTNRFAYDELMNLCTPIKSVEAPAFWPYRENQIRLTWDSPDCRDCEQRGGSCGFNTARGLAVGCTGVARTAGMPRSAKYGLIIGVGIPGLLCSIGLACYICSRARMRYSQRRNRGTEFSMSTATLPPRGIFITGLDGSTIDSYPKTLLGESRRLPKPGGDNTCPICLCEYQPKETLRTIPECNHYFHAGCIDEWLRLNGTCPLCRNSPTPGRSSASVTSSSDTASTSSHSLDSSP